MKLLLFALLLLSVCSDALKILLYNPKSSKSHVGFMNNIADVLIDAGHEVVSYMPSLDGKFGNGSNHKRARIIERECDFSGVPESKFIADMSSRAWQADSSIFALISVSSSMSDND
jgi:hypothetical protein